MFLEDFRNARMIHFQFYDQLIVVILSESYW
jgi:hypothetical protein